MRYIIHFTSKFSNLKSILSDNSLRLHYCKEDFCLGEKKVSSAVHPMVSFSQYNIKTIDKKQITYGMFGIAFTNSWVKRNKMHEVLYVNSDSVIANSLSDLLKARRKGATEQLSANVRLSIMMIKCFTKNARGYNSYLRESNFDFKKENEWRYVPTKKQIGGKFISLSKNKYIAKPDFYNDQLVDYSLKFTIKDIEYIFVKTLKQSLEVQKITSLDKSRIRISQWGE